MALVTNFNVGSVPYFRLVEISSGEGFAAVTNLTVSYGFKR